MFLMDILAEGYYFLSSKIHGCIDIVRNMQENLRIFGRKNAFYRPFGMTKEKAQLVYIRKKLIKKKVIF